MVGKKTGTLVHLPFGFRRYEIHVYRTPCSFNSNEYVVGLVAN